MLVNVRHEVVRLARRMAGLGAPRLSVVGVPPVAEPIAVHPVTDVPFPEIDLDQAGNPVAAVFAQPVFSHTAQFFFDSPAMGRSLISNVSQALMYALIRNMRPDHVFEIGTYRGGSTEAISRALHANGTGTLHTVGPFDSEHFLPVLNSWPEELRRRVRFYPTDSMDFYMRMEREKIRPGLVFVDGNHDYEFALFDIQCAARTMPPGGFIVVDNVSQAGPYYAARDFLESNPAWLDCSLRFGSGDPTRAYDLDRTGIPGTDLTVLRAPASYMIGARPRTFGEIDIPASQVNGIALSLSAPRTGTLHVQCVLRGFSARQHVEVTSRTSVNVDGHR